MLFHLLGWSFSFSLSCSLFALLLAKLSLCSIRNVAQHDLTFLSPHIFFLLLRKHIGKRRWKRWGKSVKCDTGRKAQSPIKWNLLWVQLHNVRWALFLPPRARACTLSSAWLIITKSKLENIKEKFSFRHNLIGRLGNLSLLSSAYSNICDCIHSHCAVVMVEMRQLSYTEWKINMSFCWSSTFLEGVSIAWHDHGWEDDSRSSRKTTDIAWEKRCGIVRPRSMIFRLLLFPHSPSSRSSSPETICSHIHSACFRTLLKPEESLLGEKNAPLRRVFFRKKIFLSFLVVLLLPILGSFDHQMCSVSMDINSFVRSVRLLYVWKFVSHFLHSENSSFDRWLVSCLCLRASKVSIDDPNEKKSMFSTFNGVVLSIWRWDAMWFRAGGLTESSRDR